MRKNIAFTESVKYLRLSRNASGWKTRGTLEVRCANTKLCRFYTGIFFTGTVCVFLFTTRVWRHGIRMRRDEKSYAGYLFTDPREED